MSTPHFDAPTALKHIRQKQAVKRHKKYQLSRLAKYQAELVALRQVKASYREMQQWLHEAKHLKVDHKTIWHFLHKLPELQTKPEVDHGQLS
jgi:hypothetical protein